MTQGGEAMGRDENGRVVFVPYAIVGERVVVEIIVEKKGYARARLVQVIEPSLARVTPRCAHFASPLSPQPPLPSPDEIQSGEGRGGARRAGVKGEAGCGGCQWQHIAYDAQLKFKTQIVREQFARIGKILDAPVRDTIGMANPWHYRNNVQFQIDGEGRLCFRRLGSHDLLQIKECHILHPSLDEMFRALELDGVNYAGVTLRAGTQTDDKMLILESREEHLPQIEIDKPVSIAFQNPKGETSSLIGKDAIHEVLRKRTFRISPSSFFQINTEMAEKLVELVERYLAPRSDDVLLDAFSGVGTFGLTLAPRVTRVIEIEENPHALDDARANAVDLINVEFHRGRVEDVLPRLQKAIDLVVADPPRAGIAPRALDALIAKSPRTFVYVSCDPATLARDARRLVDGGYRLIEIQPVDMFPQTYHTECVSCFERIKSGEEKNG